MTTMTLRITNSRFESISTDGDYQDVEAAYRAGVLAGIEIATQEVVDGLDAAIVEVAVDMGNQRQVARGAVSVSTARLLAAPEAEG